MNTKVTLLISTFLTASILTMVGGVVTFTGNQKAAFEATATQASLAQSTREAAYQNLLNQANNTISQANSQIAALQNQLQQQSISPTASTYPIQPDQAAAIAGKLVGLVVDQTPQLVNYNGTVAYEVVFTAGNVYVDANNGTILYNGIQVSKTISAEQAVKIAANYTGNTLVSGVSTGLYNNSSAYQVVFQNGEVVYIDLFGTVLAVQVPSKVQGGSQADEENG
jgi:uncharacterized membrane protein YkoI